MGSFFIPCSFDSADLSMNRSTMVSQRKRFCADLNVVSYSKPGPPTPARKGNRSVNSSFDLSVGSAANRSISSGQLQVSSFTEGFFFAKTN
jgi:hypothetical protein